MSQFTPKPTKRLAFVVNPFIPELFLVVLQRDFFHGDALVRIVKVHVLRPHAASHWKIFHVADRKRKIARAFHIESKRRHGILEEFLAELPSNFALHYTLNKRIRSKPEGSSKANSMTRSVTDFK